MKRLWMLSLIGVCAGLSAAELKKHDAEAIARAMESDAKQTNRVKQDPNRPVYHITAPANWINDPNGPIFHDGYWHMFYQHNPYGDEWGHMHWGHVRSRDLANWEHLPIALWPSKEVGEDHVFSGCAAIRADGRPVIFYTSIGRGKSATEYAEQWMALGDRDLLKWEKAGPVLKEELHGETKIWDWRDPFLFQYEGADYMVLGGNLNKGKGGEAVVTLYKAKDASLQSWEYLGILFKHPDAKVVNIECPNFFELDGKWVLIVSPHRRVEYFIGSFDGKKFTSEGQGLLDHSDNFYAPNCTTDAKGRRVLWGWIRGFKGSQGWNGALTLPRRLAVTRDGKLDQSIAVEALNNNREGHDLLRYQGPLRSEKPLTVGPTKPQFSILSEFYSGNKSGIRLFKTANDPGLEIFYENGNLKVGDKTMPLILWANDPLRLYVYVDGSVLEVHGGSTVASTVCFTKVHYPASYGGDIEFFTQDQTARLSADVKEYGAIFREKGR